MKRRLQALSVLAAVMLPGQILFAASSGAQAERIVFGRSVGEFDTPESQEIFIMDADGSDVTRLTDNETEDAFPALSPDGTKIAFSRRLGSHYDLFVMSVDGSDETRLLRSPNGDEVLPSWSPNGRRIAFTATTTIPGGWQSDIYRIRVDNGHFRRLTYTPKSKEFAPDWSPDGDSIAFTKFNEKRHRYGIAVVGPEATGLRWIVINPLARSGYTDANPSWSPDSQWIAFARDHGDDPYVDIFKVRRDGSDVTQVTDLASLAENPSWGRNGSILFMHDEAIASVPEDGGDVAYLTETRSGLPYWWPDW